MFKYNHNSQLPVNHCVQKEWSNIVDKDGQNYLILTNTSFKNRLLGCISKGSGEWLNVVHLHRWVLKLSNEQMTITCSLRLGTATNVTGSHALTYRKIKGKFIRHKLINDVINITNILHLIPWSKGKRLAWNVTIVHRLAESWSHLASLENSAVASEAEK